MIQHHEERFDKNEETAAEVCDRMAVKGWEVVQIRNNSVVFRRDNMRIETRTLDSMDGGFAITPELAEAVQLECERQELLRKLVDK